jgi:hypothetical protein
MIKHNKSHLNVFISTSITKKLGKPDEIARLKVLVDTIDQTALVRGALTTNAFRAENWKGEEKPSVFVPRDLKWCEECNGAVIIPEDSPGVLVEQGWLSLLEKPMLRLYENSITHTSDLVKNLGEIVPVFDKVFHTLDDVIKHVNDFMDFLLNRIQKT